jgi:hypothetical protein
MPKIMATCGFHVFYSGKTHYQLITGKLSTREANFPHLGRPGNVLVTSFSYRVSLGDTRRPVGGLCEKVSLCKRGQAPLETINGAADISPSSF